MPKPKGMCLAIGLNLVDLNSPAYQGATVPRLGGCVNDAEAVAGVLGARPGFEGPTVLLDGRATHGAVLAAVDEAARRLVPGDLFVLHYSGHGMKGGLGGDGGVDPENGHASSWILYDRPLSDDELFQRWAPFQQGVRILVLSDSCHSGAAVREWGVRERGLDFGTRARILDNQREYYRERAVVKEAMRSVGGTPGAALILISGCQEEETSLDTEDARGTPHGLFTAALLEVWNNGGFDGNYVRFHREVAARTEEWGRRIDPGHGQNPNFFPLGSPLDVMVFARSGPPFFV